MILALGASRGDDNVTDSIIRMASSTSSLVTSPDSDSTPDGDEMAPLADIHPTKHQMKKGLLKRN